MADQKLLTQTLPEFASTLVQDFTTTEVVHDLAERAAAVAGADGAGVSPQHSGQLRFATALDENSGNLERVRESGPAGPCIDAPRAGEVVTIGGLAETAGGWGVHGHAAPEAGS